MTTLPELRHGTKLTQNEGVWFAMPYLAEHIGGYAVHSRCAELRNHGYQVENKVEVQENGQKRSWYRLVNSDPSTDKACVPTRSDATVEADDNDLRGMQHPDGNQTEKPPVLQPEVPQGSMGGYCEGR